MQAQSARQYDPELLNKLALSQLAAEELIKWNGKRTLYDTGTGVLPSFRGTGIGNGMLEQVQTLCAQHHVAVYLLEVLQENKSAVRLYQKQGFETVRGLICYGCEALPESSPKRADGTLFAADAMTDGQWAQVKAFWDASPSWQNSIDAVRALDNTFGYALAEADGVLVGYGVVNRKSGDIAQLAVDKRFRRKGLGRALLQALHNQSQSGKMTALNIDEANTSANAFLRQMGFAVTMPQYEMTKSL